jgi:RNA 3'-terminal phosphate cyclase (ATP)
VIELDGSQHSGSGTLVRFGVALAALTGQPLRVVNAREHRPKPGLAAQHVAAVRACAELCGAETRGVELGARSFEFVPGRHVSGGERAWDIGTGGSATMLALGVLPLGCLADAPLRVRITGGLFQDFAPSPHHTAHVLLPHLARMGAAAELDVLRPGYARGGEGLLELRVRPALRALAPVVLLEPGVVSQVRGVALASHLAERNVAERMAATCAASLGARGLRAHIDAVNDASASRSGASLAVWAESSTGCRFGADRAGAPRRSSEAIGRFVADALLEDLASGATTDRHLADQLVLFAALADGVSRFSVPSVSAHVESNLWLAELFGARVRLDGTRIEVEGLALRPASESHSPR